MSTPYPVKKQRYVTCFATAVLRRVWKKDATIFDYNSRISWSIFIIFVPYFCTIGNRNEYSTKQVQTM